jgi:hypothetical protein
MESPDQIGDASAAAVAEPQPSTARRRLIGAGLVGLAGSLVPRLAGSAGASSDTTTGDTTTGDSTTAATTEGTQATTTTAPPKQPTPGDVELLSFAQSIELAAAELYATALGSGSLGEKTTEIVQTIHQAHVSYGQSLNALLGRKAPGQSLGSLVDGNSDAFGGSNAAFLEAARQLENTAVATHTDLIADIEGTDGAQLIASVVLAEARFGLALADLAGETDLAKLVSTGAEPLAVEG